ncbi:hypothetical protein [Streptomyces ehimensis]|uniref:Tetratricopeptide repeat protein n=1 Tax=Streptomyces ehimensis TaxID=68195 RepID=A0ABV9BBF6_9ACTN
MHSWRQFRQAFVELMVDGGVAVDQLVKFGEKPEGRRLPTISRTTLYAYRKVSDNRVGNGDWETIEGVLKRIEGVARENRRPVSIDYEMWKKSFDRLMLRYYSRKPGVRLDDEILPRVVHDGWIGGWDGAAEAVPDSAADEFTTWPSGNERLEKLARAVTYLSEAHTPEEALGAAKRMAREIQKEAGATSVQSLAARHAVAFWTGHSGDIQVALKLTEQLKVDCEAHVGTDHVLSRLARLRTATWLDRIGQWRKASRIFNELALEEMSRRAEDQPFRLLARWGMARTGGGSGNWAYARTEMGELLPQVTEVYGPDHPASLDARTSHAWAVGRAGDPRQACSLLNVACADAESSLQSSHPVTLRIRMSLAYWTARSGSTVDALTLVVAVREQSADLLGPEHPVSIQCVENEAILRIEIDVAEALPLFRFVVDSRERRLGGKHPYTLHARRNYIAAQAIMEGPQGLVESFRELAQELAEVLGNHHPGTLCAQMNLAIALLDTEGPDAALPLCMRVADAFDQQLGPEHPETSAAYKLFEIVSVRSRGRLSGTEVPIPPLGSGSGGGYRMSGENSGNA